MERPRFAPNKLAQRALAASALMGAAVSPAIACGGDGPNCEPEGNRVYLDAIVDGSDTKFGVTVSREVCTTDKSDSGSFQQVVLIVNEHGAINSVDPTRDTQRIPDSSGKFKTMMRGAGRVTVEVTLENERLSAVPTLDTNYAYTTTPDDSPFTTRP